MSTETETKQLGAKIKELRTFLGYSLAEFGELTKVTSSHIWHIEEGTKQAGFDVLLKISRGFGMKPSKLLALAGL